VRAVRAVRAGRDLFDLYVLQRARDQREHIGVAMFCLVVVPQADPRFKLCVALLLPLLKREQP
jgi:hypothetical protein